MCGRGIKIIVCITYIDYPTVYICCLSNTDVCTDESKRNLCHSQLVRCADSNLRRFAQNFFQVRLQSEGKICLSDITLTIIVDFTYFVISEIKTAYLSLYLKQPTLFYGKSALCLLRFRYFSTQICQILIIENIVYLNIRTLNALNYNIRSEFVVFKTIIRGYCWQFSLRGVSFLCFIS